MLQSTDIIYLSVTVCFFTLEDTVSLFAFVCSRFQADSEKLGCNELLFKKQI